MSEPQHQGAAASAAREPLPLDGGTAAAPEPARDPETEPLCPCANNMQPALGSARATKLHLQLGVCQDTDDQLWPRAARRPAAARPALHPLLSCPRPRNPAHGPVPGKHVKPGPVTGRETRDNGSGLTVCWEETAQGHRHSVPHARCWARLICSINFRLFELSMQLLQH